MVNTYKQILSLSWQLYPLQSTDQTWILFRHQNQVGGECLTLVGPRQDRCVWGAGRRCWRTDSPVLSVGACWWLSRAKREHSGLNPFSSAGWEKEFFIPTAHWFWLMRRVASARRSWQRQFTKGWEEEELSHVLPRGCHPAQPRGPQQCLADACQREM